MSDVMRPMPFAQVMDWVMTEHRDRRAPSSACVRPTSTRAAASPSLPRRSRPPSARPPAPTPSSRRTSSPPTSAGSRFFELKTVQIMDGEELSTCVNKPCIVAEDECYNCEWSTELTVPAGLRRVRQGLVGLQAHGQRATASGDPDGFVFNMSVGYNLEGIQSPKVDAYIEGMKDASGTDVWAECTRLGPRQPRPLPERGRRPIVKAVSPQVSNSVTESTLHGCPPDEIERIATYLITEKGAEHLHQVQPHPPGLRLRPRAPERARLRLHRLRRHTTSARTCSGPTPCPCSSRLIELCDERGPRVRRQAHQHLPGGRDRAASCRARRCTCPAARSSRSPSSPGRAASPAEFDGKLRISYSGGADARNIRELYDGGHLADHHGHHRPQARRLPALLPDRRCFSPARQRSRGRGR